MTMNRRIPALTALMMLMGSILSHAQENQAQAKGFYKDMQYIGNIQHASSNPTAISSAVFDIVDLNIGTGYDNGKFHEINAPSAHFRAGGEIYGARKLKNIDFEGTIKYSNESLKEKVWRSTLYVDGDNPFFLADTIAGDNKIETFLVEGGFSYRFAKGWRAGLRATYNVGSLSDQFDPRPDTRSMSFRITPGFDYTFGNFTIGLSGYAEWLSENTSYIKVGLENKNNTIFIFRGMGKPVTQVVDINSGWRRDYSGTAYGADIQFVWDDRENLANMLEASLDIDKESAVDGGSRFRFLGGDYTGTTIGAKDRFQIKSGNMVHNISLEAEIKNVTGVWFTQVAKSDETGLTIYEIKEELISHEEKKTGINAGYRMDILKDGYPSLSWKVNAGYLSAAMTQYPEEYTRGWSTVYADADITKSFRIKNTILGINLAGSYNHGLSSELEMNPQGTRFNRTYHQPEIDYLAAGCFSAGGEVFFNIPLSTRKSIIWLGCHLRDRYYRCTDAESTYTNASRNILQAVINLTF